MKERLQKYLSRAGIASRRAAETLITAGRIRVNNQVVTELGTKVEPGVDLVTVDGKLTALPESQTYIILYKPPGVVTTLSDPQGRETVQGLLSRLGRRVFPIGRLDYDAEGALLLTDDGELANRLTHPKFEVERTYLAKVKGVPDRETLDRLRRGVRLEDGEARPKSVDIFELAEKNTWLKIVVTEGRPHLIKRICAAIGHPVARLFRPAHAGISVEGLKPGAWRPLSDQELEKVQAVSRGAPAADIPLRLPARRHGASEEGKAVPSSLKPAAPTRPQRDSRRRVPSGQRPKTAQRPRKETRQRPAGRHPKSRADGPRGR